jgi:hypothetical protein
MDWLAAHVKVGFATAAKSIGALNSFSFLYFRVSDGSK